MVVTSWGSLGAQVMNDYMVDFVVRECRGGHPFHHIYGVGKRYYQRVLDAGAGQGASTSTATRMWTSGNISTICPP